MKTYQNFTTEEFLDDPKFRAWVKSGFINNNEVFASLSGEEIDDAIAIMRSLSAPLKEYPQEQKDKLFQKIHQNIEQDSTITPTPKRRNVIRYLVPAAVAASLLLIFYFHRENPAPGKSIICQKGSELNEMLPDGSMVLIDGGSQMEYGNNFQKFRKLTLNGRAFFEVKKGSTFTVSTPNGSVTVLGTSFSVLSRNQSFEVVCKTGKVRVSNPTLGEVILTPGEKSTLIDKKLIKSTAANDALAWKDGNYYFNDATLNMVIEELENQFNIKMHTGDIDLSQQYTGFFSTSDLNKAMIAITWPLNLKYEVRPDGSVYLKK